MWGQNAIQIEKRNEGRACYPEKDSPGRGQMQTNPEFQKTQIQKRKRLRLDFSEEIGRALMWEIGGGTYGKDETSGRKGHLEGLGSGRRSGRMIALKRFVPRKEEGLGEKGTLKGFSCKKNASPKASHGMRGFPAEVYRRHGGTGWRGVSGGD